MIRLFLWIVEISAAAAFSPCSRIRMYSVSPRLIEEIAGGSESHSASIRAAAGPSFK
jgi:hypothetical protein